MKTNGLKTATLAAIVLAAGALGGPRESFAQITTYGEDPVPNSQFWSYELTQGYGVDPVPQSTTTEAPYQWVYGVDPIPDARYYRRKLDVMPLPARAGEVLTLAEDDPLPGDGAKCDPQQP